MVDQSKGVGLNVSYLVSRQTAYQVAVERDHGRLTSNSETISIVFVVCRSLGRIGLELEIVNSDGCGVRGTN